MTAKKMAVIGLGTMGAGIAQVAVQSGIQVLGVERDAEAVAAAEGRVSAGLDRLVKRDRISTADRDAALERLHVVTDLDAVADADIVVEAIFEDVERKTALFGTLDRLAGADAILASNTSTIPLVILAAATSRPERVVGLHFFNPVPAMKLVEVIRTPAADPAVVETARQLAQDMGKSPVLINDVPGFVGNLLIVP
ncbi:MAG TPA: 3-hydroxyacyl-CoA dehydrogenase family protein, partial [Rugosimonospora sp.]|nr:3-hydroxyacyl-CoA dehydrogenase family protein [Rugosimonospora sp.]